MKIIQLTPGAGGDFYCENCLRDGALVRAICAAGHEMITVPLYLPLRKEQVSDLSPGDGEDTPIFFGGVNVYLQQKWRVFRHTPRWLDRLFDSRALLKLVARKASMTQSDLLGLTTLSMLRGQAGRQVKELNRLVDFLRRGPRPDLVCLSNILLAGLVPRIKAELNVPVVSILQDEEGFLDDLGEPYSREAWRLVGDLSRGMDAFLPMSDSYARRMTARLKLPPEKVHVVHGGVEVEQYQPARTPPPAPAIGFLSQMTEAKGLATLADAFILLKRRPEHAALKLRIAGGRTSGDEGYIRAISRRLDAAGLAGDVEFIEAFDFAAKLRFIQSLAVMSVPTVRPEAFGLFVLESLACGVPVVLPRHGAFVELVEATGGGALCNPNDPADLAEVLASVLTDDDRRDALGRRGRRAVERDFTVEIMAAEAQRIFAEVVAGAQK